MSRLNIYKNLHRHMIADGGIVITTYIPAILLTICSQGNIGRIHYAHTFNTRLWLLTRRA